VDFGTNFNVLYDGYLYLIYRKIDRTKKIFEGDFCVRKVLQEIIDKSEKYEPISIPPTPFREELIIESSYEKDIQNLEVDNIEDDKIKITLPKEISIEDFFVKFYYKMHIDFQKYFFVFQLLHQIYIGI